LPNCNDHAKVNQILPLRSFVLASRPAIIPDMPIFGSDGGLVGIVDRVSGVRIVVQRTGVSDADQHFIPLAWVAGVTDRVTLDCPAANARAPSATAVGTASVGDQRRVIGPVLWTIVGVVAVLLIYGASHLLPRAKPDAPSVPVPATTPSPKATGQAAVESAPRSAPPAVPATPLAQPATVAEYLNSDDPVPQRFSLDSVGFAPGSTALDGAATKTIDGIAGVMTTHLNTKIKLAVDSYGGAVAVRRAAAIRAALIIRGVAPYRIAMGPSRTRSRGSKSGVEMVILAK
jgi:outer membrane protein OmpA-like peptidoglycan-associated protein